EHNEDGSEKSGDAKAAAEAAADDDHGPHGIGMREIFFMAATGILALLLVVTSLRRRQSEDETTELT
ncbi:MAG: hypothetical protein WEB60_10590, partial [Terrimicrobiaceae bacterium]